jgi:hypothetical protein
MIIDVLPKPHCHVVRTLNGGGVPTFHVVKYDRCTCGGTTERPCLHIQAVADYQTPENKTEPPERPITPVRETPPQSTHAAAIPSSCPLCEAPVVREKRGRWRCTADSSHYFLWRGELNDGAIRKFLTQPHPNKIGAYYSMSHEQRDAFLQLVARRMHSGGYTPYD